MTIPTRLIPHALAKLRSIRAISTRERYRSDLAKLYFIIFAFSPMARKEIKTKAKSESAQTQKRLRRQQPKRLNPTKQAPHKASRLWNMCSRKSQKWKRRRD